MAKNFINATERAARIRKAQITRKTNEIARVTGMSEADARDCAESAELNRFLQKCERDLRKAVKAGWTPKS